MAKGQRPGARVRQHDKSVQQARSASLPASPGRLPACPSPRPTCAHTLRRRRTVGGHVSGRTCGCPPRHVTPAPCWTPPVGWVGSPAARESCARSSGSCEALRCHHTPIDATVAAVTKMTGHQRAASKRAAEGASPRRAAARPSPRRAAPSLGRPPPTAPASPPHPRATFSRQAPRSEAGSPWGAASCGAGGEGAAPARLLLLRLGGGGASATACVRGGGPAKGRAPAAVAAR